jgi:Arc/MetJ-type ribon-helix-helix transcriptional regulator
VSTQIAIRLPDEMVQYVDSLVASGTVRSRADLVLRALERERRHRRALRDVEILRAEAGQSDPDGLDDLAAYAARLPRPDLD